MAAPHPANEVKEKKKNKKEKKKTKKEKKKEEINEALNKLNECYSEACELDPRLVQFSQTLRKSTSRVAAAVNIDVNIYGSPAIHSINEAATGLLAVGSTTVRTLQALQDDISDEPAILTIIGGFIQDHLKVIKFIEGVRRWLVKVRSILADLANAGDLDAVLAKLREFKASVNGMTEMLNEEFRKFYNQQFQKMSQIHSKKQSIEEKIKSVKVEKKVNEVIFLGIASALKICSLIPGAQILTTPIDLGQLILSTFRKWHLDNEEERQKQQNEILQAFNKLAENRDKMGERIGIHELDRVIDHFDKLELRIKVEQLSKRVGRLEKLQGDELTSEDWRKEFEEELKVMLTEFGKKMEAIEQNIERGQQDATREMKQFFEAIVKKGKSKKGKSKCPSLFSVFLCGGCKKK